MPLTREDIATLAEAVRFYGVNPKRIPALRKRLRGKELKHLGLQTDGWFYRLVDITDALAQIEERQAV